ncbi:MAG TPA: DUF6085 family protein [Mycobacteriales bacterium]
MTDTTLPDAATMPTIDGWCPMGCGQTLVLGAACLITCSNQQCENPTAASDLLADDETGHLVTFGGDGQHAIRHPLAERLGNADLTCDLAAYIGRMPAAVLRPGRYRVRRMAPGMSSWGWERMPDPWDLGDD